MKTIEENGTLSVFLEKRIDATNAPDIEKELIDTISSHGNKMPVFDASEMEYISSAGLRVFLRLKKITNETIMIRNVSPAVYDIFDMTGFTRFLHVEKTMRFISVQGLEKIGAGRHSTVYRLDEETILKVVKDMTLEAIRAEMQVSKKVLLYGIPAAISYDIVQTEEGYGEIYEMFRAGVLSAAVMEEPERRSDYLHRFVNVYREIHDVEIEEGVLDSIQDRYSVAADALEPLVSAEEIALVRKMIDVIPRSHAFIHGDFHMNNVMLQDEELLLIDVGEAAYGHALFDFAQTAWAYELATIHKPELCGTITGMTMEEACYVRDNLFREYFCDESGQSLENKLTVVHGMALLRRLLIPFLQGWNGAADSAIERLDGARKELFPIIDLLCDLIRNEF